MHFVLLLTLLSSTVFAPTVERAFSMLKSADWAGTAAALDHAYSDDPGLFAANNLHYLRGRIAERQGNWTKAKEEFTKLSETNPLYTLATWHAARASAHLRDAPSAERLLGRLPRTFPADLRMQIAREASGPLALKIYQNVTTREARLERGKILGDKTAFWSLLRERNDDDVALQGARLLNGSARTARQQLDLAETYMAHRQFDDAQALYRTLAETEAFGARARYALARVQFLREDYRGAIRSFERIAQDYPGTDWQKDSDYQIASSYWRLGEFGNSENAYLGYIEQYGKLGQEEGAVRNLVDVYRAMGNNAKALALIDRMTARRTSVATRQVLLFSKAKILFVQQRFAAAGQIFRDLARTRLRPTPGGTTTEEARYFEALSLSKAGSQPAAETIWRGLARDTNGYYGRKSAEKLGKGVLLGQVAVCQPPLDPTINKVSQDLEMMRRPLFTLSTDAPTVKNPVSELAFLQLWDEASYWLETAERRPNPKAAAELAYAAGRFHRSIVYAGRLPETKETSAMRYPAGFRQAICEYAREQNVDPLWLHAIIWQESKYNPNARSGASARGLMQFIPETANVVGRALGMNELPLERLYEPGVNIRMGAYYWASLMKQLSAPEMALAAYNGGIDNVGRWRSKWPGGDEFFVADIGFTETKRYVMNVFRARAAYQALGRQ